MGRCSTLDGAPVRSIHQGHLQSPLPWIRAQGFNDTRKSPNHAFRHWFKSACMKVGIQDSIADAIQGHKGTRGEADRYRHADLRTMADAISCLKVPECGR